MLLGANGVGYLVYGVATGRLRDRHLPIRLGYIVQTLRDTLRSKLAHEDLSTCNTVQKVLYIVPISAGIGQIVGSLAIWKPVQFSGLVALLGGFQGARLVHFAGMATLAAFLAIHVELALILPPTLRAMLAGGPRLGWAQTARTEGAR